MRHVDHIRLHKDQLAARSVIIRAIREFFWSQKFLEVETPSVLGLAGQEPYLDPVELSIHDEKGQTYHAYLHTSPEYTMKKMLAAGFEKIFFLGTCFRDKESFGGVHNPEFTMLEWYRAGEDFVALMDDVEALFTFVIQKLRGSKYDIRNVGEWKRVSMRNLWVEIIGVDLHDYLTDVKMRQLCVDRGFSAEDDERYEDWFYKIFLNEIEPKLTAMGGVIVHHYPAQMAALARLSASDSRYAERFEVYIDGVEIANAFGELTDAVEQRARLEEEQQLRKQLGKTVFPIDDEFIAAVGDMPDSSGIALGVDRLVMTLLGCQEIDDVLSLPMSKQTFT